MVCFGDSIYIELIYKMKCDLIREEKVKMPFVKLNLPREQTELTEKKQSNDRTMKCVHLAARQIGHFKLMHLLNSSI